MNTAIATIAGDTATPRRTAQDVARRLMVEAEGDLITAKELCRRDVAELLADLGEPLVIAAVDVALENEWRATRPQLWKRPHVLRTGELSQPSIRVVGGIMRWPCPGGKYLRDAKKPELLEWATEMRADAVTMKERAQFYEEIAAMLPDNRVSVGEALQEADLDRCKRRAMKE